MAFKIFYSWQSDLPSPLNRSFIEDALKKATKKAKKDFNQLEAVIDRDSKDEAGSPDIVQTIFSKIEESDIFVCDVSIINKAENYCPRPTPNPNVLVELGYALKTIGSSHIIMVINETHGYIEDLPFDLDHRRVLKYNLSENEKNDTEKFRKCKEELVRDLANAVNIIVSQYLPQSLSEDLRSVDEKVSRSRLKFKSAIGCAIERVDPNLVLPSFLEKYQAIEDEFDGFFVIFDGQSYFWHEYDKNKLIEYANKIATLLKSCVTKPEIKGRLFDMVIYDDLLPNQIIKIASIVTPVIEQESPDLMDIYFKILAILDKRTTSWKQIFESQRPDFEDDNVADQIRARRNYIEKIDALRLEILQWSLPSGKVNA
jgi:hypothetical protein